MYDDDFFFVPNPIHRYDLARRDKLVANPDGSVRKLPRQVDSSKLEFPRRATARGNALAAGFPAHRAA